MVTFNDGAVSEVRRLARREFARSFDPRDWYARDDDREDRGDTEARVMWVFRLIAWMFAVGFFTPDREWVEDERFPTRNEAALRVHYLNGGT